MVNDDKIKILSEEAARLCDKHGITSSVAVINSVDDECLFTLPWKAAAADRKAVSAVCDGIRALPFVKSVLGDGRLMIPSPTGTFEAEIVVGEGCWTHGDADEKALEEQMRYCIDPKFAKKKDRENMKERRKHWKDFILDLPKKQGGESCELFLTMSYEPYDQIKRGEKNEEFRAYNDHYNRKLLSKDIGTVKMQRGYGGRGRAAPEQMTFEVKYIRIWDPDTDQFTDPDKPTEGMIPQYFVIGLGKRLK